jgi:hypothetical protein
VVTTLAVATPHALVLTVSHGVLFRQSPSCAVTLPPPSRLTTSLVEPCALRSRRSRSAAAVMVIRPVPKPARLFKIISLLQPFTVVSRACEPRIQRIPRSSRHPDIAGPATGSAAMSQTPRQARAIVSCQSAPKPMKLSACILSLNVAIPFAVRSGFRSSILPALPTSGKHSLRYAPGLLGNAAQSSRADSVVAR